MPNPENINHIAENFKQLIHDFCYMAKPPLDLDIADFHDCIAKVDKACEQAHIIIEGAWRHAETSAGFTEPRVIKGNKETVREAIVNGGYPHAIINDPRN